MIGKRFLTVLALGGAAGLGLHQDAANSELVAQVKALETRVTTVEGYLAAQVAADKALITAIDTSVEQGFTAGINFEARKTLVAAWKARSKSAAAGVPGGKAAAAAEAVDPRIERRRR
ncbi:MAG: hypothetical protein O2816_05010 [Planctomycetota bacterium]|nr:hypothetical protein [Planctomycetota bacterium]